MSEHAFRTIGRDIKENRIGNLAVLFGRESYLIDWAHQLLIDRFINPACRAIDYTFIEAADSSFSDVVNACEMLPVMSEKKVVTVRFTSDKSKIRESELKSYVSDIPDSTLLILCIYQKSLSKTMTEIAKQGSLYDFSSLDERTLSSFIVKELRNAGKTARNDVIREFIHCSGYFQKESEYTLYNVKNDIIKLCAHCEDEEILREDVEAVVSGNTEINIFEMVECICRNRKDEALRLLHNLLSSGEQGLNIAGMIIAQYEIILSVKELRDRACNLEQIKKTLKIHEYRIRKSMALTGRYSVLELKNILMKAYSIDNDIKTGNLDERTALEVFICEV